MQKITAYILLIAVLVSGSWLLYKSLVEKNDLQKIEGKLQSKNIQVLYKHKGTEYYGMTFLLEGRTEKPGIYIGTNKKEQQGIFNRMQPGEVYQFYMDPSEKTRSNVNLGVRKIMVKDEVIYKESNRSSLIAALSLIALGLVSLALLLKYNSRRKPSTPYERLD
jgi:hypothetical protein